jgi:hypothetical protein
VRVRVASPTRLLAEIGWTFEGHICDWVRLRPCAFRAAVGRGWEQRQEGHRVDFCGLGDSEPIISMEVGQDERILPGDIFQVRAEAGGWHHVLATLLPAEGCHAVLGLEGPPLSPGVRGCPPISLHDDPVTGVTLVHAETDDPDVDRYPHLVAHLTAIRGRLLAEELIADPLLVR